MWLSAHQRWGQAFDAALRAMLHRIEMTHLEDGDILEITDWYRGAYQAPWSQKNPEARWMAIPRSDLTRRWEDKHKVTLYFRERKDAAGFKTVWQGHGRSMLAYTDGRTKAGA